jgi:hypothetical protein
MLQAGKETTALFTAMPDPRWSFGDANVWDVVTANAFGLPPQVLVPYVGSLINGGRGKTVDKYGTNLTLAPVRGDGWRTCHDVGCGGVVRAATQIGGAHIQQEVYHLFAMLPGLAPEARQHDEDRQVRQGKVPDFMARFKRPDGSMEQPELAEFKCIRLRDDMYRQNDTRPCSAVDRRARQLPGEYRRNIRAIDTRFDTTGAHDRGEIGPAESRFNQFGKLLSLVTGAYGEFSVDLRDLIDRVAEAGAGEFADRMLCTSMDHAKAVLKSHITNTVYFSAVREHALLMLDRMRTSIHGCGYRGGPRPPRGPRVPPEYGYRHSHEYAADGRHFNFNHDFGAAG